MFNLFLFQSLRLQSHYVPTYSLLQSNVNPGGDWISLSLLVKGRDVIVSELTAQKQCEYTLLTPLLHIFVWFQPCAASPHSILILLKINCVPSLFLSSSFSIPTHLSVYRAKHQPTKPGQAHSCLWWPAYQIITPSKYHCLHSGNICKNFVENTSGRQQKQQQQK